MKKTEILQERIRKETLINMPTAITSALIKEAAKCDCFASDLFIDYVKLYNLMENWNVKDLRSHYYFGFRDHGVDNEAMVLVGVRQYRSLYKLSLSYYLDSDFERDEIQFTLEKLPQDSQVEPSTDLLTGLSKDSIWQLWERFGSIPMDPESETMEKEFLGFPKGTHREEIWHWFDEHHEDGVYDLLYNLTK